MSQKTAEEYLDAVRLEYFRGNRETKAKILDGLCEVFGYHRKSAVRALNDPRRYVPEVEQKPRGRKSVYKDDATFCEALRRLWFATEQMCVVNFQVAIPDWLPAFEAEYEVEETCREKLLKVSAATAGRILEPSKLRTKRRGGTKPGSLLRTEIPIRTDFWDVTCPGYMEADTVAHCGGSMSGEFMWSLTLTDIDTTWTENRAVWHKLAPLVRDAIIDIETKLPFPILGFDSDNGGEFINRALVHYFAGKFIPFTRSREYHKNDNAHVEQKNNTHVRELLGYDRIDVEAVIPMMNELYANEVSLLKNHFYPSLKLERKERVMSRIKRHYKRPKTPYQRVLESPHVAEEKKQQLREIHSLLNPIELKRTIHRKLRAIMHIVHEAHRAQAA